MLALENVILRPGAQAFAHTFEAGEICVVLGSNQSGKTDLCRLVAGLPSKATGDVSIDNISMQDVAPRQRPVAMVYQAFINYPNLSVAQNIASPLRAQGLAKEAQQLRVEELAKMLGIDTLLSRFPAELSGGQQQRLAIARALAKQARVLVLDEPLVNLDFKLREALEGELRGLLEQSSTVVLYTSSDPRDAFTLGDQVLLLAEGEQQQSGPPMRVYQQPASMQAMALLSDPGVNQLDLSGVVGAVRPEHVLVEAPLGAGAVLSFELQVTALETNGDESIVHGVVHERDWVVRCPGIVHSRVGELVAVHVRSADVMQF